MSEYIVFDAVGGLLATPLLAWRLEAGRMVPWSPDTERWWHSTGISFQATQPFLTVRDHNGTVIEDSGEVRQRARDLEKRLAQETQLRLEQEQRLAELQEQLRLLQQEME